MRTLHFHKLYTPSDISKIIQRKEEDILNLLEERRAKGILGRKICGFWYIRGSDVIQIQKLLKEKNVSTISHDLQKEEEKKTKK